jgi:hypothetical protein
MGYTVDNIIVASHAVAGSHLGYGVVLHRGDQSIYAQSVDVSWPDLRAAILAARNEDDAALDSVCASVFGQSWWASNILARNARNAARNALKNYVPQGIQI